MQEKLIQEINRINLMMGTKKVLKEGPELAKSASWLVFTGIKASKAIETLMETLTKMKLTGVIDETDIDGLVKQLESVGATADDIQKFKKLIKDFAEASLSGDDIDFYKWFENLYQTADDVPGLNTLKKMASLTDEELGTIQKYYDQLLFASVESGAIQQDVLRYVNLYLKQLKEFRSNRKPNTRYTSKEDIYRDMEERAHNELKTSVENKLLTELEAKKAYEAFCQEIRKNSDLSNYMDDMQKEGLIGTNIKSKPVEWTSPKGKKDNVIDSENIEDIDNIADDIPDSVTTPSNAVTRQVPDPYGAGAPKTETLDDLLTKEYNKIVEKAKSQGDESLTPIEKEIKESVENWKKGVDLDSEKLKTKIENQPSPELYEYVNYLRTQADELTEQQRALVDAFDDFEKNGTKYDWDKYMENAVGPKIDDILDTFSTLGTNFQRISKKWTVLESAKLVTAPFDYFYTVIFRPVYRWFAEFFDVSIEQIFSIVTKGRLYNFEDAANQFVKIMGESFDQSIRRQGSISAKNIKKIQQRLMKLKTYSPIAEGSEYEKILLEDLWEAFKKNAGDKVDPKNKKDWDTFISLVENEPEGYFSLSTKEILGDARPLRTDPDQTTISPKFMEKGKKFVLTGGKLGSDTVVEKFLQGIIDSIGSILSVWLTGTLMRPKQVQRYFIGQGKTFFGKTFQKGKGLTWGSTVANAMSIYAIQYILVPVIGAIFLGIDDGIQRSEGIKNENVEKYGSDWNYFWHYYFQDPIINYAMGNGFINKLVSYIGGKDEKGKDTYIKQVFDLNIDTNWGDWIGVLIPGWADDTVVEIIELQVVAATDGGNTQETAWEMAKTEAINLKLTSEYDEKLSELEIAKKELENAKTEQQKSQAKLKLLQIDADMNLSKQSAFYDTIKQSIDEIFGAKSNAANTLKSRLVFKPQLPADFTSKVGDNLKNKKHDKSLTDWYNSLISLKDNPEEYATKLEEKITEIRKGSVVIKGDKDEYYIVVNLPSAQIDVPKDKFTSIFDNDEDVKWVSPKFKDLNPETTREYKSLKDFYKNIKNL